MLREDADDALKRIQGLFPKWEPTDEQLSEWDAALLRQSNKMLVENAIGEMFRKRGRFNKPDLGFLLEEANKIPSSTDDDLEDIGGVGAVFVFCTVAPSDRPSKVGAMHGLYFGRKEDVPDVARQTFLAGSMVRQLEKHHGGTWEMWDASCVDDPEESPPFGATWPEYRAKCHSNKMRHDSRPHNPVVREKFDPRKPQAVGQTLLHLGAIR